LFLLTKEGWAKSAVAAYHAQKQALSRFFIGAILTSDSVLAVVRRELKRISPGVHIALEQINEVLINEVVKREVIEGERFHEARRTIARVANKPLRVLKTDGGPAIISPQPTEDQAGAVEPPKA
jgi:endonuclease III-like uncharacterized protein